MQAVLLVCSVLLSSAPTVRIQTFVDIFISIDMMPSECLKCMKNSAPLSGTGFYLFIYSFIYTDQSIWFANDDNNMEMAMVGLLI